MSMTALAAHHRAVWGQCPGGCEIRGLSVNQCRHQNQCRSEGIGITLKNRPSPQENHPEIGLRIGFFQVANDSLPTVVHMDVLHTNKLVPAVTQAPKDLNLGRISPHQARRRRTEHRNSALIRTHPVIFELRWRREAAFQVLRRASALPSEGITRTDFFCLAF